MNMALFNKGLNYHVPTQMDIHTDRHTDMVEVDYFIHFFYASGCGEFDRAEV